MVVATAVAMARPVLVPACGSSSVEGDSRVVMLVTPWGEVVVPNESSDGLSSGESGLLVSEVWPSMCGEVELVGFAEFVLLND